MEVERSADSIVISDGNIITSNAGLSKSTATSLAPFQSTEVTPPQVFKGNEFARALFESPASLMSSPQFDLFNSPLRGTFAGRAPGVRCQACARDIQGSHPHFSCSHLICGECAGRTEGKKCVVCSSPAGVSSNFPPHMFLSPTITPDVSRELDSSINSSLQSSMQGHFQNGLGSGLHNVSLGVGELGDPFSLWDNQNKSVGHMRDSFEVLNVSSEEHPPVFSPGANSESRFPTAPTTTPQRNNSEDSPKALMSQFHGSNGEVLNHTRASTDSPAIMHRSILSPATQNPSPLTLQAHAHCAACGPDAKAVSFCMNCRELLCGDCLAAHHRVRMTRDHVVIPLHQILQHLLQKEATAASAGSLGVASSDSSSRPSSVRSSTVCGVHEARVLCVCDTCAGAVLCLQCLSQHLAHRLQPIGETRTALTSLLAECRAGEKAMGDAVDCVQRMGERVDSSVQTVASEVRSVMNMHLGALEERKRELLQRLETIRTAKQGALKLQGDKLQMQRQLVAQALKSAENSMASAENEQAVIKIFDELLQAFAMPLCLQPQETDVIKFVINDSNLINSIRQLGEVESGACARSSHLIGEGYKRAIRDRPCVVFVQLRDACGEECVDVSIGNVTASISGPDGAVLELEIGERERGVVSVTYQPVIDGTHVLNVFVRGVAINGCPVNVDVRHGRNYADIAHNGELFSFGKEGSGDGELCRPWGICVDLRGRVLVADRSNNRIQVFDKDGNFLSKFGTGGTRSGQFDRPAGITVNSLNHVIVADKDNHRVQVFDEKGGFLLKFGERGRPVGMFNYPWGVACNQQNHIAVSDTRNHRVQVFNSNGQFIRKCGFDTAFFYKHLDSPRGLCYLADGQLLITDFNNHRLAVLAARNSPEMKVYGNEGDGQGMFCRPQGVKTDAEGHILVCDSRNNRIQVFSGDDMRCVAVFGNQTPGFQLPQELPIPFQTGVPALPFLGAPQPFLGTANTPKPVLDRPTDLAIGPDGRVYVVDFGNNCVRVF